MPGQLSGLAGVRRRSVARQQGGRPRHPDRQLGRGDGLARPAAGTQTFHGMVRPLRIDAGTNCFIYNAAFAVVFIPSCRMCECRSDNNIDKSYL